MTAVAACERQGIEQPWHAMIEHGAIVAAGLVAERTGKPTFADAGRADDQQVLVPCDPVAGGELGEQCLVETARRLHVDVLDDGRLAQAGELQSADEPLVLALDGLAVDHEREPLLEAERGNVGLLALLLQRLGHAGEPERDQAVMCGMREHRLSFRFLSPAGLLRLHPVASVVVATTTDVGVPDRRAVRRFRLA